MSNQVLLKFAAVVLATVLLMSVAAVVIALIFQASTVNPLLVDVLKTVSVSAVGAFATIITKVRRQR